MVRRNTHRRRRANIPSLTIGFIGITLAVLSFVTSSSFSTATASKVESTIEVDRFDMVRLPVPAQRIPVGGRLADYEFTWMEFPRHQQPKDAIEEIQPYLDQYAAVSLSAGWILTERDITGNSSGQNPLVEKIPQGMRAMTIRVDSTAAVEGWAGPDTLVDVLLIEKDKASVIAEQVRVLSAERRVAPVGSNDRPDVPSTVTVLVTQEQCLAINTAIPRGRIAFALRSHTDTDGWGQRQFTFDDKKPQVTPAKSSGKVEFTDKDGNRRTFDLLDDDLVVSELPLTSVLDQ